VKQEPPDEDDMIEIHDDVESRIEIHDDVESRIEIHDVESRVNSVSILKSDCGKLYALA
jgi:hypothetical protein